MTDLTDNVNSFGGSAYNPATVTTSIASALRFVSSLIPNPPAADGDSLGSDTATAMLTVAILANSRLHQDKDKEPKTIEELWTPLMNDILFGQIKETHISLKNERPSKFARGRSWQNDTDVSG